MDGWKTWLAAIGLMLSGLGLMITGFISDPIDWQKITEGWALFMAGLGMIGIGHKIVKARRILEK